MTPSEIRIVCACLLKIAKAIASAGVDDHAVECGRLLNEIAKDERVLTDWEKTESE